MAGGAIVRLGDTRRCLLREISSWRYLAPDCPFNSGQRQAKEWQAGLKAANADLDPAVREPGRPVQPEPPADRRLAPDQVPGGAVIGIPELAGHGDRRGVAR